MVLWEALGDTVAFAIVMIFYLAFTPAANGSDSFIISNYGSLQSIAGGLTVGQFTTDTYNLFGAAIVIIVLFIIIHLVAAAGKHENTSQTVGSYSI